MEMQCHRSFWCHHRPGHQFGQLRNRPLQLLETLLTPKSDNAPTATVSSPGQAATNSLDDTIDFETDPALLISTPGNISPPVVTPEAERQIDEEIFTLDDSFEMEDDAEDLDFVLQTN
ncbi:hypothetical protein NQZ68_031136 [Dissostichus eleginoides]|nr:hypothetical protein NQZ68_031136 [Dissostichus eleginoides]